MENRFAYNGGMKRIVESVDTTGRTNQYEWLLGKPPLAKRILPGAEDVEMFSVGYDKQLNVLSVTDPLGRNSENLRP